MMLNHLASQAVGPDPSQNDLSRRTFLQAGAAAGGGLLLSLRLPFATGDAEAADGFAPNAFIRIESDGQIVLTMPYVEMGQGTYTSIPMLIAEELEVDLTQVRLDHAPPNEKLYGNPLLGGYGQPATRTRSARRGSRCAKPGRSREPCWSPRRQSAGTSTPRPAAREAAKCVTSRRDERPNTAISPPTPYA
jgi:Molybdopterin cofactor-binding domain